MYMSMYMNGKTYFVIFCFSKLNFTFSFFEIHRKNLSFRKFCLSSDTINFKYTHKIFFFIHFPLSLIKTNTFCLIEKNVNTHTVLEEILFFIGFFLIFWLRHFPYCYPRSAFSCVFLIANVYDKS